MRHETTPKNASFTNPSKTPAPSTLAGRLAAVVQDARMYIDAIDPGRLSCTAAETHLEIAYMLSQIQDEIQKLEDQRPSTRTEAKEGRSPK